MKHPHTHNKDIPTTVYALLYICLFANIAVIIVMITHFM